MLGNKWLLYTLLGSIIIHVSVIYVPFLQVIFNTYSLSFTDWLITGSLSLAPFVINETLKVLWKFRE